MVPATAARAAAPTDLIISEYVEGSSFNKAVEFYNGTDAAVDLSGYELFVSFNGGTSTATFPLSGSLAAGDAYVFADEDLAAYADQTTNASLWNGDDFLALRTTDDTVVDSFGTLGLDPGTSWGTPSTANNTLRRNADVCTGDTVVDDAFDPSQEWSEFGNDTFDGLGSHAVDCEGGGGGGSVVINEFSASTTGTDVEYVELYGPADTDLSAYTVLQVEGDEGSSNFGTVIGDYAVGTTDAAGFALLDSPSPALQNGTLSLLLVRDWTGETDVTGDLGTVVDSVAVDDGDSGDQTWAQTTLDGLFDGDANTFAPGGASRIPDGADTDTADDWVRNDFDLAGIEDGDPAPGEAYNTPGAPNAWVEDTGGPGGECGDPTVTIGSVQGDGATTPVEGETVAIEGVVVGDFQYDDEGFGNLGGFHVQDAGDGDAATSDGVFVYEGSPLVDVNVGDRVHVVGEAAEYETSGGASQTQVYADSVVVCASGVDLPAATDVLVPTDLAGLDDFTGFERYEGMYVTFPQDLAILEYFNYDRFGEIVLGTERQFQPTAVYEPGSAEAVALETYNDTARITLDDGLSTQNPQVTRHPNGDPFTLDNRFRGGDLVTNTVGVIDESFGLYRIQPTGPADFTVANPRPDVPDVGGRLQVAAFNVLNYFPTLDYPTGDPLDNACGPDMNQECRGADTELEFERQEAKIVAALAELDADVVGLMEIENSPTAVETLVAALNAEVGEGTYAAISTGYLGTDAIKVGLIYKTDSVDPKGEYAILDQSVDPRFLDSKNRPVLAQTFVEHGTGADVLVAVNHLKSKGSSCSDVGDPDLPDTEGGNCDGVRTAAAEAIVDWLDSNPTKVHPGNILVTGDLNSYDKEDPIDAIVDGGYVDLIAEYQGEYAYSYVFDGQLGYLDHALANADLAEDVTGAAVWHANTDEPDLIDYDMSFKSDGQDAIYAPDEYRASDHDAVLVGMDLDRPGNRNCQDRGKGNGNGCRP
nr:ExeM/NucH family extracellular endonuclease [Salsipaludibacter albus]